MASSIGLSGINAAAKQIEYAGQNIANANTTAYKQNNLNLSDMVVANGPGGLAAGAGVKVSGSNQNFSQGLINTSSNSLDCAITGAGFFRMQDSGSGAISYSRNGAFKLDADNYIVNSLGAKLTGLNATNGTISGGAPQPLKINASSIQATVTTAAAANINLDAGTAINTATFDPADRTTYDYSSGVTTYNAQGTQNTTTLYFTKTALNTWAVHSTTALASSSETPTDFDTLTSLNFNDDGTIASPDSLTGVTIDAEGDTATIDVTAMTQYASGNYPTSFTQNGKSAGVLTGFEVSKDGNIYGTYTNGQANVTLGQISVVNFASPTNLKQLGNSSWAETAASGAATIGTPNSGSFGSIQSFALEQSNVDLTSELIGLMAAQRLYQANAQTIKVQDEIAQTTVNLR